MTVDQALAAAKALGVDRLDAHRLLARRLDRTRTWLIAHGEATLTTAQTAAFEADTRRRADGEPLAYIVGEKEFRGRTFRVSPDVLVPRPETELLVDWALEIDEDAGRSAEDAATVDLGTGSGAIAISLAMADPPAARPIFATDASAAALAIARSNADRLGADVTFLHGDWWRAVGARRFRLAVANPPYIAVGDSHLAALRHEPAMALAAGPDGLDAIRTIVDGARRHLVAGGWLLLEHGNEQATSVRSMLASRGFEAVETRCDLAGHPRCTGGRFGGESGQLT